MRTHSPHVAASTHLLIGEVRAEHKNERFADSLTACSGIDSRFHATSCDPAAMPRQASYDRHVCFANCAWRSEVRGL